MAPLAFFDRKGYLSVASATVLACPDLGHRDLVRSGFRGERCGVTVPAIHPSGVGAVREHHRGQRFGPAHEAVGRDRLSVGPASRKGRTRRDEPSAQGLHPVDVATRVPGEMPQERVGVAVLSGEGRTRAGQRRRTLGRPEREPVARTMTPGAVDGLPGGPAIVAGGAEGSARRHPLHEDLVAARLHLEDPRVADLAGELNAVDPVGKDDGWESIALGGPIHHDIAIKRGG